MFILTILLTLTLVPALTIYAGESIELELEKPYDYYSIVGNSTEVNLEVTQNGNNVTIIPDKYMGNDSFEVIFFDKEKEIITVYSGGGGGGSRTVYKDRDVIEYVDRDVIVEVEKEIEGEPIETIVNEIPTEVWIIIICLIIIVIIDLIIIRLNNNNERGYEKDE